MSEMTLLEKLNAIITTKRIKKDEKAELIAHMIEMDYVRPQNKLNLSVSNIKELDEKAAELMGEYYHSDLAYILCQVERDKNKLKADAVREAAKLLNREVRYYSGFDSEYIGDLCDTEDLMEHANKIEQGDIKQKEGCHGMNSNMKFLLDRLAEYEANAKVASENAELEAWERWVKEVKYTKQRIELLKQSKT